VTDWHGWHGKYDEPGSPLERRLRIVRGHVAAWLDEHPGPVRVVSACAGQGRDLLPLLAGRGDVRARLVELDPANVAVAERTVRDLGLHGVEVVCGDAGATTAYEGAVPADLVLMCGVFGNVSDDDVRRTVSLLPMLCAPDATVVWTRSRRAPDLTPRIREWFAAAGFAETAFDAPEDVLFSVGVARFAGTPRAFSGEAMFAFVPGAGTSR
jgi:hypothetical protein